MLLPTPWWGPSLYATEKSSVKVITCAAGEGHAEVNAIASVKDESLLKDATIYVSLELFSLRENSSLCRLNHTERNSESRSRLCGPIFFGSRKGNPKLRDAGIEVTVGVLEKECRELIRAFVTFNLKKRPYIT